MTVPLPPGATIGMLGSGQLGRMSGQAARRLGYRLIVLSPDEDAPASHVADRTIVSPLDDAAGYRAIAPLCDVLTYEFENVVAKPLLDIAAYVPVYPRPAILDTVRHRLREKEAVRALGVPTADFVPVRCPENLDKALDQFGKGVLKRALGGYDGKGQRVVWKGQDAEEVYRELAPDGAELIFEEFVPFVRELSVIVARSVDGRVVTYPCTENIHRRGILHLSIAPARTAADRAAKARHMAARLAEGLDLVGVMGVELFETDEGLLVNELAPRPHNSGHYTLDACYTSQFEQHIRAVAGLPLGDPSLHTPAVMLNLLGQHMESLGRHLATILRDPLLKLHVYGKREARPGRKMAHLTALGSSVEEACARLERVWPLLRAGDEPLI